MVRFRQALWLKFKKVVLVKCLYRVRVRVRVNTSYLVAHSKISKKIKNLIQVAQSVLILQAL